jgi:membrane protein DedA with SNARE-associated domain
MFEHFHQLMAQWFTSYAYEPMWIYSGVFVTMFLSSFGFPFPEEIVIVSVGIVGHLARHPDIYPPPYDGAHGVNIWIAAAVGFFAVFWSDLLIYWLGHRFGRRLIEKPWFGRTFPPAILARVKSWMNRYGFWASGLFRFTPGLRCPGHMACGMMGVPFGAFVLVDGGAALLAIPTQILLIGFYGENVLQYLKQFRFVLVGVLLVLAAYFSVRWYLRYRQNTRLQVR